MVSSKAGAKMMCHMAQDLEISELSVWERRWGAQCKPRRRLCVPIASSSRHKACPASLSPSSRRTMGLQPAGTSRFQTAWETVRGSCSWPASHRRILTRLAFACHIATGLPPPSNTSAQLMNKTSSDGPVRHPITKRPPPTRRFRLALWIVSPAQTLSSSSCFPTPPFLT